MGSTLDDSNIAGSANVARFAHNIIFVEFSARGPEYRFLKFTKQRKGALPDEVLEVRISEEEYTHFEVVGTASEADVICTKTNRKRFGQEVVDEEEPEEEDTQKPQPKENGQGHIWTDEDTEKLKALIESGEELDYEEIAKEIGCSSKTIERKVKKLKEEGSEE